jgi:hypothetical protein
MFSRGYASRLALGLCIGSLASFAAQAGCPVQVGFDFRDGAQGWVADFADYPLADRTDFEFEAGLRELPEELGAGTGFWLHSHNRCDDIFMFLKRALGPQDGILPDQAYRVRLVITFASNAPSNCSGIGGAPGESVYLKAGATDLEPLPALDADDWLRMNVDKGNQASGGPAASVAGDIANGIDCADLEDPSDGPYVSLRRVHLHEYTVESSAAGELWLLVGTDSGFEGPTGLYYQSIVVRLVPLLNAAEARPAAPLDPA